MTFVTSSACQRDELVCSRYYNSLQPSDVPALDFESWVLDWGREDKKIKKIIGIVQENAS